jgi:tetratricopeptide (TPR) repeat protein/TolB-like protein
MLAVSSATAQIAASSAPASPSSPTRILVLPFENTGGDVSLLWLGEASAILVADGFKARGLPAIGRDERVRAFEELHLPLSATLSRATVIKAAKLLGATELVTGTFRAQDRTLTVQATIIRVDVGRARQPLSERGQLTDLFDLHDRLVRNLTSDLPATSSAPASPSRPPLGAFENYIKGLVATNLADRATFLESAIQDFPAFERARLSLWEVRTDQGDHVAALAAVRAIPSSSALSARARYYAATSMLNLERYDDAFETFGGLRQAPGVADVPGVPTRGAVDNNLGVIQIRRGGTPQSGTAAYFLTKATEEDPGATDYFFNLGYAYALDRNFQGAIYWLREAVRRDPADADAHFVLAAALQGTGSAVEAARERDLARRLSSRYEELVRTGASDRQAIPRSLEREAIPRNLEREAIPRNLEREAIPRNLERVQLDPDGSGGLRASVIVSASAQRDQRELATFHLERGRRLFEKEQDGDALAELRRAIYLSPYEAQAHLLIGRIFLRGGRAADAIDALKISIWSADTAPAHIALAEAYLKTGDAKQARAEAERAVTMDPASADARRMLNQIR